MNSTNKMNDQLFQWNFVIQGLLPGPIKLKQRVWLEKGELLLVKEGENLEARLLGDEKNRHKNEEYITKFLRIASLISSNPTELIGEGGHSLRSRDEFGRKSKFSAIHLKLTQIIPSEITSDIEEHAPTFIKLIGKLHNEYTESIENNDFLKLALTFYYNATRSLYSNEGFINSSICLESLFNDGASDISYKLAQRASFLLGLYGIDPIETTEKLKSLYKARSKIVHGAASKLHGEDSAQINEYARLSIIVLLLLLNSNERKNGKKSDRKTNLLKEIDYAMLEETRRKSLRQEILKGKKVFEMPIPRIFEKQIGDKIYRVSPW